MDTHLQPIPSTQCMVQNARVLIANKTSIPRAWTMQTASCILYRASYWRVSAVFLRGVIMLASTL
eukprot:scaffold151163_cov33-Tisochrysis_lutea.AAC.5